jgi:amidase
LGSSSGSAVAAAANFAAATVGTETQGSLIAPAGINSIVALKPSLGLVSRDYVIPLLDWQDTPGPMGRTVSDVAVLLTGMTGVDNNDPATADAAALAGVDFTQFLKPEAAANLRIGVQVYSDADIEQMILDTGIKPEDGDNLRKVLQADNDEQRRLGQVFRAAGFEVVEVSIAAMPGIPNLDDVLPYGFRDAINRFLAGLGDQVEVKSLADIIAANAQDLPNRAPYGQGYLEEAQATAQSAAEYQAQKEQNQGATRAGLHKLFTDYNIDVLITNSQAYAPAGFPAITVPRGYASDGQPTGLLMLGDYLGDPKLIAAAYAYEQATHARVEPDLEQTLQQIAELGQR